MNTGFITLICAGLGWAIAGVMLSYTARNSIRPVAVLAPQMLLALCLAVIFVPDYGALDSENITQVWPLAALIMGAGLFNISGILILQRAMRAGHHGVAWAIGQSALVVPFLVGSLCFGDRLSATRILGVAGIMTSLAAFGTAKKSVAKPSRGQASDTPRHGFLLALAALLILGTGQTVITLPSHLPGFADPARLRVPFLYIGHCIVCVGLWVRRPVRPNRRLLAIAACCAVTAIISTFLLFKGLDQLAQAQMASLGFPVAVGACIFFFSAYSLVVLRENFTVRHSVGMAAGAFGLIFIALSG